MRRETGLNASMLNGTTNSMKSCDRAEGSARQGGTLNTNGMGIGYWDNVYDEKVAQMRGPTTLAGWVITQNMLQNVRGLKTAL